MVPPPRRGFWNSAWALPCCCASRAVHPHNLHWPRRHKLPLNPPPFGKAQRSAAAGRLRCFHPADDDALASTLFASVQPDYENAWLSYGQIALFALLSAWVVTGFDRADGLWVMLRGDRHALSARSVAGHTWRPTPAPPSSCRSATKTWPPCLPGCGPPASRWPPPPWHHVRRVCASTATTRHCRAERAAWEELRNALAQHSQQPQVQVYLPPAHAPHAPQGAGNVADFCRRWGGTTAMVVLDADSVMSGDCIVSMAKLMEAHPTAGHHPDRHAGHRPSLHARAQQFASRVTGRLFTLGMQYWQLGESHYWGHNAIIRVAPFMQHCALAPIQGTGGLSGGIMSHDFVEAALMRRAGCHVAGGRPDRQLRAATARPAGELQRDRRWCQGNLQNARLMAEPGIHPVHRPCSSPAPWLICRRRCGWPSSRWARPVAVGRQAGGGLAHPARRAAGAVGLDLCLLFLPASWA